MAPAAILHDPEYVEFSHQGSWGHRREVLKGEKAKPTFQEIPMIDMTSAFSDDFFARLEVAKSIAYACENVGFFYLKNHRIPRDLMEEIMDASRRYFEKPMEQKMQEHIYKSKDLRGYEPVHGANVDPNTKGGKLCAGI